MNSKLATWFELHGPEFRAKSIEWRYDFDTDMFTFSSSKRSVKRNSYELRIATIETAIEIIKELEK